jgi:hypothetical protein
MEDKSVEQGWQRKQRKCERIQSGEARGWEEDELRGGRMQMAEVRNLAPTPLVIYRI